ncbi:hypothetical protein FB550_111215 [Neobacillus bataviensis]|uniref:Uncharacterized protein n=1 Tax=Neobacillus bataviensis TaxID=220685 RepID=A0A561CZD2_9BACI|nr:hypothetical protein FB550_111215 [Neobacillus bataviensis]
MRNLEKYAEEKGETVDYHFGDVNLEVLRVWGLQLAPYFF